MAKLEFTRVETETQIATVARIATITWNDAYTGLISKEQIHYMIDKMTDKIIVLTINEGCNCPSFMIVYN